MGKFTPKSKDQLRKDAEAYVNKHLKDLDDKAKGSVINKLTDKWLKDEEFKASEKNKTAKAREEAKKIAERKEHYKKLAGSDHKGDHKKKDEGKGSVYKVSADDKAYLHGKMGLSRTEVRILEKAMKVDEISDPFKAMKGTTYKGLKSENDKLIKQKGGELGASRGGSRSSQKTDSQIEKELSGNLPKGFDDKTPKEG